ncbi:MAG: glycosyltransferase family 4 protein [Acidimicrobiales bacterium]
MATASVIIDGRSLTGASSYRGLGSYVRQLVAGLAELSDLDLSVLAEPAVPLPAGVGRVPLAHRAPDRWATAEHQFLLARRLARLDPQIGRAGAGPGVVFHSPALDPPRRVGMAWVQTIADVLPLADRHPAYAVEARRWRRWAGRVRSADAVIALSRHSADQAVQHLGVSPDRVQIIHLAPDPHYRPADAATTPGPGAGSGTEQPRGPYLLSVAEYAPHKGFSELGLVMSELVDAGLPHRLVVAGRVTDQWRAEMEKALGSGGSEARGRIDVIGWVPDLLPLYQGAEALVCTSRHEGFGLPLVEAMATATPVVAFANSAVTEVVGDGGALVADGDCTAMAGRLAEMLSDPWRRLEAAAAARRRAGCFSWAETVRGHVEVYRRVAGPPA